GDGSPAGSGAVVNHTYATAGVYRPRVTGTDNHGASAVGNLIVTVGNTAPKIEFLTPTDGDFAEFTDKIHYKIRVTDPEDGAAVDCTKAVARYLLGDDSHSHPMTSSVPD